MIVRNLGRRSVIGLTEDFPLKLGDVIRVTNPDGTFLKYKMVGAIAAVVTHHTPTTNKFKIGGPDLRG